MNVGYKLRQARRQKNLSQLEVARRSQVSLATIQNIESGRANPAWKTLEALFRVLSLKIEFQQITFDWPKLAAFGCPLLIETAEFVPNSSNLKEALSDLDLSNLDTHLEARERMALASWLWALHDHYPSLWFHVKPATREWFDSAKPMTSIKLRRLALSNLARYL